MATDTPGHSHRRRGSGSKASHAMYHIPEEEIPDIDVDARSASGSFTFERGSLPRRTSALFYRKRAKQPESPKHDTLVVDHSNVETLERQNSNNCRESFAQVGQE